MNLCIEIIDSNVEFLNRLIINLVMVGSSRGNVCGVIILCMIVSGDMLMVIVVFIVFLGRLLMVV